jgi:hypothetical protein
MCLRRSRFLRRSPHHKCGSFMLGSAGIGPRLETSIYLNICKLGREAAGEVESFPLFGVVAASTSGLLGC